MSECKSSVRRLPNGEVKRERRAIGDEAIATLRMQLLRRSKIIIVQVHYDARRILVQRGTVTRTRTKLQMKSVTHYTIKRLRRLYKLTSLTDNDHTTTSPLNLPSYRERQKEIL